MDNLLEVNNAVCMRRRRPNKLYVGEWIARLGRKQGEVAKAVKIGESYMSLIISGGRTCSRAVITLISNELGISVNDLERPPPSSIKAKSMAGIRPDQILALGELMDAMKAREATEKPPKPK